MAEQASFFSADEMAALSSGIVPPAPAGYALPIRFPSLKHAKRISLDFETKDPKIADYGNGVYRKDGKIVGGAVAAWDKDDKLIHAEYYPVAHRSGMNCDQEKVFQYLRDNLNFYEGELTGTNLLYDGDWGQSVDITPVHAKWRDIQWSEALIDEMAYNYKLETLAHNYGFGGKVTNELKSLYGPDYIKRFDEVHPGHARAYGLGDVLLPNGILKQQYKKLEELGLTKLYELESRLTPFLLYLRRQGVRMDLDKARENKAFLSQHRADKLKQISKLTGLPFNEENLGNKKFLEYAFKKMGVKAPRSENGDVSVTDKWLHHLCDCKKPDPEDANKLVDDQNCGHAGRLLESINKYKKAESTFVDGYVFEMAVGDRLHGDFHPLRKADDTGENGTESGRLSGSNPNLQNIPARDPEIGPMCRSMFVPERGGSWWVKDYSQIEYRFLIHMASIMPVLKGTGEAAVRRQKSLESVQSIIKLYKEKPKTDFHQALADLVTAVLGYEFKRSSAKNLNFGLVYGMGLQKLATDLNMLGADGKPNDKVKPLMDTYHGAAPFIKDLYDLCIDAAANKGEIRTILNRRSQFEFYEPARQAKGQFFKELPYEQAINTYGFDIRRCQTHKALNRLLQGSAADMMKVAMVDAWEAGVFSSTTDFTCSLTVHDELDGTIFPTKRGQECSDELDRIMMNCLPLNVPVLVGADKAENWAEAK